MIFSLCNSFSLRQLERNKSISIYPSIYLSLILFYPYRFFPTGCAGLSGTFFSFLAPPWKVERIWRNV